MNTIIQKKSPLRSPTKLKNRPLIIEESLKALFQKKKIIVFSNTMVITGTCVDFVEDNVCIENAHYKLTSSIGDVIVDGNTEYIIVSRQGKSIALLGE